MADIVRRSLRDGIVEGEYAPAVMLRDSLDGDGGSSVFDHFLCSLASHISNGKAQAKGLVVVAMDRRPQYYQALLAQETGMPLGAWFWVVDCFTDPLGWENILTSELNHGQFQQTGMDNQNQLAGLNCTICRDIEHLEIMSALLRLGPAAVHSTSEGRFSVAIDSMSTLLRHNSVQSVANFLTSLRSHGQISSLLWWLHADVHDTRAVHSIEYISSTVVYVEPIIKLAALRAKVRTDDSSDFQNETLNRGIIRVRQKRRNGRILEQVENFQMERFKVKFIPISSMATAHTAKSSVPLLKQVQFNLQLTDKEREDRAKVVLPFEHQGDGREVLIYDGRTASQSTFQNLGFEENNSSKAKNCNSKSSGIGEIHYLRDSDDERPDSDEDPDDDLDI